VRICLRSVPGPPAPMEKVKNMLKPRPTPQQQLREWQRRLRNECRVLDRQIRGPTPPPNAPASPSLLVPPTSPSPGHQGDWRSGSRGLVLGVIGAARGFQGLVVGCCLVLRFAPEMAKAVTRLAERLFRLWGLGAKPLTLTCK
jgi:hypothetical protein